MLKSDFSMETLKIADSQVCRQKALRSRLSKKTRLFIYPYPGQNAHMRRLKWRILKPEFPIETPRIPDSQVCRQKALRSRLTGTKVESRDVSKQKWNLC